MKRGQVQDESLTDYSVYKGNRNERQDRESVACYSKS